MEYKKRLFSQIFLMLATLALCFFIDTIYKLSAADSAAAAPRGRVIIIDAGHGDFDPGASFGGHDEKDINLEIALNLGRIFELNGYTVRYTRTTDRSTCDEGLSGISEKKRSDIRNRVALGNAYPDSVYISIHQNSFSDSAQAGPQVFFGTQNENSELLAKAVQGAMIELLQPKRAREVKRGTESVNILVNVNCPIILVECGFMSNPSELKLLLDSEYAMKTAFSIFYGYLSYEALERATEGS